MIKARLIKKLQSAEGLMNLDVSMNIAEGSFTALYGPSGAGKTSVLRMIAGLIKPDDGFLSKANVDWFSNHKMILSAKHRNTSFVFQDYALFPSMTIRENLAFAMKSGADNTLIEDLLSITELTNLADQRVIKLSGGQQQRVAFARALVQGADIILLDEPFNALDGSMRKKLRDFLKTFHANDRPTIILVSHDINEVIYLTEEVKVIKEGRLVDEGKPIDVFSRIKTLYHHPSEVKILNQELVNGKSILTVLVNNQMHKIELP